MAWTFEFEKRADKEFSKLPPPVRKRINSYLIAHIQRHPDEYSLRMSGQSIYSRIRIGDYRLIIRIEEKTQSVHIIKVGHRKDVYKL